MAILFLTVLSGACASVRSTVLDPSYQVRPVPGDDVIVYFEGDTIPEHSEVAILAVLGVSDLSTFSGVLDKLRDEAGKLGANAISTSWMIKNWPDDEPPPPEIGSATAIYVHSPRRPNGELWGLVLPSASEPKGWPSHERDTRTGMPTNCC